MCIVVQKQSIVTEIGLQMLWLFGQTSETQSAINACRGVLVRLGIPFYLGPWAWPVWLDPVGGRLSALMSGHLVTFYIHGNRYRDRLDSSTYTVYLDSNCWHMPIDSVHRTSFHPSCRSYCRIISLDSFGRIWFSKSPTAQYCWL
jgi:hypothetical protein